MPSDFWAYVPYEQCPPDVQHNIRVIGRMDAFHAATKVNADALSAYVESLYQGKPLDKPKPVAIPSVDDEEMEFMMEDDIKRAAQFAALMLAEDSQAIARYLAAWTRDVCRKADYLAYNRKALEKRYRKGAGQEEIDRVKKLITDGEEEIAFLQPRIDWARSRLS